MRRYLAVAATGIYLTLVLASLAYLYMDRKDAFCGLPAMVITAPGSFLLALLGLLLPGHVFDQSIVPGVVIVVLAGTLNATLIYRFFR